MHKKVIFFSLLAYLGVAFIPIISQNLVFPFIGIPNFNSLCIAPISWIGACFEQDKFRAPILANSHVLKHDGYSHGKSDELKGQFRQKEITNKEIVEPFFRSLFENTSAGYVIYGKKPVYLGSFCHPNWLMPGTKRHQEAVESFLVYSVLKDQSLGQSAFMLSFPVLVDPFEKGIELLLINREAFQTVVSQNLVLFKYKYGYAITPESLLEKLSASHQTFSDLFRGEIALQGMILGYGTDNSIAYERASTMHEVINLKSPAFPLKKLPSRPKTESELWSRLEEYWKNNDKWEKVKQESRDFTYYQPKSSHDRLKLPFSFLQSSPDSSRLIRQYQKAQTRLSRALKKKNFSQSIMKILKIDLSCLNQSLESPEGQSEEFSAKLSKSLGSLLRYIFSEQISPEFFEGISAAQNEEDINKDEFKSLQFFETLREQEFSSSSRRKSQIESLQFFRKAASQANVEILITNKLCIKTLKKTDSSKFISAKTKNISAHYKIYDIYGNILHGSFTGEHPLTVDLWGLIPGLVHGLLGMKEGEIREIYIHPDFAYGTDSNFAGGKSFLVQMELIKIDEESATSLPSLHPIDAEYVAPYIESSNAFETMQKRYNYFCGYKIWSHYKKAVPLLQLNLIQEELLKTQPYSLAEEERVKLAMLSWLIYHNPSCYPELPP